MKTVSRMLGFLVAAVGAAAHGQHGTGPGSGGHTVVRPDEVRWGPPPPGLPPGCRVAVLAGNPAQPGAAYVLRAKLPDGYTIPPHWHPVDENVTVLTGTLRMGTGDTLDLAATRELPAGSFCHLAKGNRHFAVAKGETVIQTHGVGPFEVNYVNPADDPRKSADKK